MSFRIRIIQANDFIKATAKGSLDLEESKRLLQVQTFTSFAGATEWLTVEGPDV